MKKVRLMEGRRFRRPDGSHVLYSPGEYSVDDETARNLVSSGAEYVDTTAREMIFEYSSLLKEDHETQNPQSEDSGAEDGE